MNRQGLANFLGAYGFEKDKIEEYMKTPYEMAHEMVNSMSCHDCLDYHNCSPKQADTCRKAFCRGFIKGYEKRK